MFRVRSVTSQPGNTIDAKIGADERSESRRSEADECARVGCQRTGVEPIQLARKASDVTE